MKRIETKADYKKYVDKKIPNSNLMLNILKAFIVGGIICVIGQLISDFFTSKGLDKEAVSAFTSVSLVFLGIFLTAINVYNKIGK
jgi:stage V sporulation protein AC